MLIFARLLLFIHDIYVKNKRRAKISVGAQVTLWKFKKNLPQMDFESDPFNMYTLVPFYYIATPVDELDRKMEYQKKGKKEVA